jgi:hypothetical protein
MPLTMPCDAPPGNDRELDHVVCGTGVLEAQAVVFWSYLRNYSYDSELYDLDDVDGLTRLSHLPAFHFARLS